MTFSFRLSLHSPEQVPLAIQQQFDQLISQLQAWARHIESTISSSTTVDTSSGVFTTLSADPASPADNTWWVVKDTISSPNRLVLRARDSGTTYDVAAISI